MSTREGPARLSASVLSHLAWRAAIAHPTRALLTVVVVGLTVMAIVATSGRTDATRRAVAARLEDPSARLVRVIDRTGQAGLRSGAVARVSNLGAVEWAIGLSPAGPLGRTRGAGGPREGWARAAIGTRAYWGSLAGPLARLVSGRLPGSGEALVGPVARAQLGLADGAGTIDDEARGPTAVVGIIAMDPAIGSLGAYALIHEDGTMGRIGELIILVRTSAEVEPLLARLPNVLGAERPDALGIDRAQQLLALRAALVQEVGSLDAAVLIGSLASGTLLVGALLYGAIAERRREFGIRRSQGATRGTIAFLVVGETVLLAVMGSAVGAVAGNLTIVGETTAVPDPMLSVAVSILMTIAAIVGSLPAAALAAFREPLYVLRST